MSSHTKLFQRLDNLIARYLEALMFLVRDRTLAFSVIKEQADKVRIELETLAIGQPSPGHNQNGVSND